MPRQLSTCVSDFVLALSAYYVIYQWHTRDLTLAALGLLIQGLAASAGVARFAMVRPEGSIVLTTHKAFTWLATAVGILLMALAFCGRYGYLSGGYKIAMLIGVLQVIAQFLPQKLREDISQAASGIAMLTILFLCIMHSNMYGVAAVFLYVIAGAVIGAEGSWSGILRVDLLHYILAIGNICFLAAL